MIKYASLFSITESTIHRFRAARGSLLVQIVQWITHHVFPFKKKHLDEQNLLYFNSIHRCSIWSSCSLINNGSTGGSATYLIRQFWVFCCCCFYRGCVCWCNHPPKCCVSFKDTRPGIFGLLGNCVNHYIMEQLV